ncbi:hypothetical protein CDW43_02830 [Methylophaga nitratireducenticrescens]|jgi:hypothetical protein|nr:hypothetical protein CDW43_02830 [Methylophaga nitratireducenticrescens]
MSGAGLFYNEHIDDRAIGKGLSSENALLSMAHCDPPSVVMAGAYGLACLYLWFSMVEKA